MRKQTRFLLGILLASLLGCGGVFWFFERPAGIGEVLWWWVVTASTVGYGDVVPVTVPGRVAAVFAILVGIYAYTYAISLIIEQVQERFESAERGLDQVDSREHVLVCEYTAYADELIQQEEAEGHFAGHDLVLLTSLVDRLPYPQHKFVYGFPINPEALRRANVSTAAYIFVFANERFRDPDKKTLHVVSRIMRFNDRAPIFVELNDPEHAMLEQLPRSVIPMKTEDLLHAALNHRYVDVRRYLGKLAEDRRPSGPARPK